MRLLILLAALAGCDISYVPCSVRCAPTSRACPSGFLCGGDDYCHRQDDVSVSCGGQDMSADPGDLASDDLSGADFSGADFSGADFSGSDLSGAFEGWRMVSASHAGFSDEYTCGVRGDGTLWCWGRNEDQVLNTASQDYALAVPSRVGTAADWVSISTGDGTACGIRANGAGRTAYCWGLFGPLAQAGNATDWASIDVGLDFQCGIRDDGQARTLHCWGTNADAQLGTTGPSQAMPTPVPLAGADWSEVRAGWRFACARRGNGELWCWGHGGDGQIGDGNSSPPDLAGMSWPADARPPHRLPGTWDALAVGQQHACAIKAGHVHCWGKNTDGQCGITAGANVLSPQEVESGITDAVAIAAGGTTTCVLRTGGTIVCFGGNAFGQLANGTVGATHLPQTIAPAAGWTALSVGSQHVCGMRNEDAFCWGSSDWGELGDGRIGTRVNATRSGVSTGWTRISSAGRHACGIQGGVLKCWGKNDLSQVQPDAPVNPDVPRFQPVVPITGVTDFTAVETSATATCALAGTGRLYCFGAPVISVAATLLTHQVQSASDWTDISVGPERACGVRSGMLYCWGTNTIGQLGDNGTTDQTLPKRIGLSATWQRVSVGDTLICGLDAGGLYCWDGFNAPGYGKTPTRIGADGDWKDLSVGGAFGCGIREETTGTFRLYCWGSNLHGALGNGGVNPGGVGILVRENTMANNWARVSAGRFSVCASRGVVPDLYCWGRNTTGQVANGMLQNVTVPALVAGFTDAAGIGPGDVSACAINASGELWCWGSASYGQLSDDYGVRFSPVAVSDPP
jgi:alpha-tubulin suppressor-like RCC1 family protein